MVGQREEAKKQGKDKTRDVEMGKNNLRLRVQTDPYVATCTWTRLVEIA